MDAKDIGAGLFGRSCRLPVALWALRNERFYQSEPPAELGPPTAIRQELARLTSVGLLREDRRPGDSRVYYQRTDSPWWRVFEEAAKLVGDADAG